ncbi:hypothetical protein ACHAXR_006194 [Thalassiosira sp. AJA248-18]
MSRSPSGSSEKIDGEETNRTVESVLDASISRSSSSILEINNNEESVRNSSNSNSNSNSKSQNKPKPATTANP